MDYLKEAKAIVLERIFGGAKDIEEAVERVKSYSPDQLRERSKTLEEAGRKWINQAVYPVLSEVVLKVAEIYRVKEGVCWPDPYIISSLSLEDQLTLLSQLIPFLEDPTHDPDEVKMTLEKLCRYTVDINGYR
jgi:hypothetical protein